MVGAGYLIWTVAVAVDRNDKDVFPPVLPAAIALAAFALAAILVYLGRSGAAFALSAVGTLSIVATLFTSLYPRVMVSSPDFANSLTVPGAASEHYTLAVMSVVAAASPTPIILLYQGWTYYVFRARVTGEEVRPPSEVIQGDRARPRAELPKGAPRGRDHGDRLTCARSFRFREHVVRDEESADDGSWAPR